MRYVLFLCISFQTVYSYTSQSITMVSEDKLSQAASNYEANELLHRSRSFILSGFGKADACVAAPQAAFGLDLWIYYHDGSQDRLEVHFDKNHSDWQFASGSFTTDGGKVIETIEVACYYLDQPGTAHFDNISLIEVHGTEVSGYTYYEDGLPEYYYSPSYTEYYEYEDKNVTMKLTSDFMKYDYTYYDSGALHTETVSKYEYTDLPSGARQEWYDVSHYDSETQNIDYSVICTTTHTVNTYGLETTTTIIGTGEKPLISSASYATTSGSKIFGKCLSQTNTDGVTTQYVYNTSTGLLTYTKCNGEGLYYLYDSMQRVTSVYPLFYSPSLDLFTTEVNAEQALYSYDAQGRTQSITTATTTYTYEYDSFGNTTSISVGDDLLVSYLYAPGNGKLQSMTYSNGTTVTYFYDTLDRISKACYTVDGILVQEYVYTYTVDGALKSVESTMDGRGYEYTYDSKGQMIGYTEYDTGNQSTLLQATYLYNTKQQLDTAEVAFSYTAGGTAQSDMVYSYYEYRQYVDSVSADGGDMLSEMTLYGAGRLEDTTAIITYQYDSLYRMTEKVRTWNETLTMRESYDFADDDGSVYASTRIDEFTSTVGATSNSYTYTYDSFGNIQTITDSAGLVTRYYYDDQQQLLRENNPYTNTTYVYTYDRGGNRTSRTTYTYTTGSLSGLTGTTTNYTYDGDRLTAIGSTAIM